MSSILKALQKLESETLEKGTGQSWLHSFNAGQKAPGKQRRIHRKPLFALLCVGLVMSGSAAFIFLQNEPGSLTSLSESQPVQGTGNLTAKDKPVRTDLGPDKALRAAGTDQIAVNSSRPAAIGRRHEDNPPTRAAALDGVGERGAPGKTPAGGPVASSQRIKSVNTYPEKPLGRAERLTKEVSSPGQEKSAPLPEPLETPGVSMQPGAMESPDTATHANQAESAYSRGREAVDDRQNQSFVKRIQTPDINLHAISWTPDVKTRIAVINGSIVREGDTISGYRVSKINKDDIILSEGGDLWRLAFRGR